MDFENLEFDDLFNEVCGHIEWSSELEKKNPIKAEITFSEMPSQMDQNSLQNTQRAISADSQKIIDSSLNIKNKNSKKSYMQKGLKKQQIKKYRKIEKRLPFDFNSDRKSKRVMSKYNNMGGFLIGTFSEILNSQGQTRIFNGLYEVLIDGQWVFIDKINPFCDSDLQILKKQLASLKLKLWRLPRKDGSKKDVFRIVNTQSEDNEMTKLCKRLIRKELINSLNQQNWLCQHVMARDFRPSNDDKQGTKKQQRHKAYMKYLLTVRNELKENDFIPKRIKF